MAERRSYQQQLSGINIPTIDFAAERQAITSANNLANSLGKMTDFVLKHAASQAKIEGAEYGADKAPDSSQLTTAFGTPDKKDDAVAVKNIQEKLGKVGDTYSIFGTNARAAALKATSDDLQAEAKKLILALTTKAEADPLNPDHDPEKIKTEIQAVIAGYAAVFDKESPSYAKSFRASLNLYSYGELATTTAAHYKAVHDKAKSDFETNFQTVLSTVGNQFKSGAAFIVGSDGKLKETPPNLQGKTPPTTKNVLDAQLKEQQEIAIKKGHDATYVKNMAKRWNDQLLGQAEGNLFKAIANTDRAKQPSFLLNLNKAIGEIESGTHLKLKTNGGPATAFLGMPREIQNILTYYKDDKEALSKLMTAADEQFANVLTAENQQIVNIEKNKNFTLESINQQVVGIVLNTDAEMTPNLKTQKIRQLIKLTYQMDSEKGKKLEELMESLVGESFDVYGDTSMDFNFNRMESDGPIMQQLEIDMLRARPQTTFGQLLEYYANDKLIWDDFKTMAVKLEAQQDSATAEYLKSVRARLQMPSNVILNATEITAVNKKVYGRIEAALINERTKDGFNLDEFKRYVNTTIIDKALDDEIASLALEAKEFVNMTQLNQTILKTSIQLAAQEDPIKRDRFNYLVNLRKELKAAHSNSNTATKIGDQLPGFFAR